MRSFSHWSLRYACDKANALFYEWTHPNHPWLTPEANAWLEHWLERGFVGVEWGSGRSTVYFAARVARLTSVEHDPVWHKRVQKRLRVRKLQAVVTHHLYPAESDQYVAVADTLDNGSIDFTLVDGESATRGQCALRILPKIRPGGVLVVDDIHRFLPSNSRSPGAIPLEGEPATPTWKTFAEAVAAWPLIWTSSGVKDTAIWRRPER